MPIPMIVNIDLTIDLDKVLPKIWDRFLKIFGKDADSEKLRSWLEGHMRASFLYSKTIQCIGMHEPILLTEIYQPTRLIRQRPEIIKFVSRGKKGQEQTVQWESQRPHEVTAGDLLRAPQDHIITAGPGWGKTTLLRWLFLQFLLRPDDEMLPFLITLRRRESIEDLHTIVNNLVSICGREQTKRVILLVDGYDEISTETRKEVSDLLLKFNAQGRGKYYLTCRDYYEIYELKAPRIRIAEFSDEDQIRFVQAFLQAYGSGADGKAIVDDLHRRHLSDLTRHPLLLTLAAITGSSPSHFRVRNVVSLIDSALNTLSLRWDQSKGLTRETTTPLDGAARIKLLKRLAYTLELEPVAGHRAANIVQKQLDLKRWEKIEPLTVLIEMAQFYGIFVPIGDCWGFVHRSLQDFLAAQYWVETGEFAKSLQTHILEFDSRTAFAGCLIEDATEVMEAALAHKSGLPAFVEMLANDASFKHARIAAAIARYYERYRDDHYYERTPGKVECALQQEFVTEASSRFLDYIVQTCSASRAKTTDTIAAYALHELHRRRTPLSQQAYEACAKVYYPIDRFVFDIRDRGTLRFIDLAHH